MAYYRAKDLTPSQLEEAKRLREMGYRGRNMCPRRIGRLLQVSETAVRRALHLQMRSDSPDYNGKTISRYRGRPWVPCEEALAERERRLNAPYSSIGAVLFGDPPVGFSALDRKNAGTPA